MSLDDHELEQRLRAHLQQQADAIHIEPVHRPERPHRSMPRSVSAPSRGVVLAAAAATVVVVALGLAAVTGLLNQPERQEVATVSDEENGDNDSDDDNNPVEGTNPKGDSATEDADGATPLDEETGEQTMGDGVTTSATSFEVIDITDSSAPGLTSAYDLDDGAYIVLSTAPGRVAPPGVFATAQAYAAFEKLLIPRTFYVLDPTLAGDAGRTWQANTVADRHISGFEVSEGVLYAVSTGLVTGEVAPAIGSSTDRGASWSWRDTPELGDPMELDLDVKGEELIIAGFTPGFIDYDQARTLATDALSQPLLSDQLFTVTADFFEYALSETDEAQPSDYLDSSGLAFRRVRWSDVGVDIPPAWRSSISLARYNPVTGALSDLDLPPLGDEAGGAIDPTSRFDAMNRTRTRSTPQVSFSASSGHLTGAPEVWALTGPTPDDLTWSEAGNIFDTATGTAGTYRFQIDFSGELPRLQRATEGPWETLSPDELVPNQGGVVSGSELVVQESRYGLFVDFNGYNGPSTVLATIDGETWQAFDTEFESFSVLDGDGEVLLIGNRAIADPDVSAVPRDFVFLYRLIPTPS